ncbi:hypothetical protein VA596_19595 [Amycolatopsis sp., V23-08]|uniref:Serine/threonine protein kinase n=1 Tax=Amycolatopsis heterodermiae TaxID=3110235 RepID=A0ABU5R7G0_9PSEU|nr:hypothetical protein [Amycolatopsis sp., V23-08]MEA5361754.1 hypothetical protein [Amycolatopsis sp., V23-08]
MDPEDDVRVILTGAAADTPPMRLEAADVIERGGRIRRRRKRMAVVGTSTATAVILAVAGFLAGYRFGPPDPVQPADPGLSTIGTAPPSPTKAPAQEEVPATSIAPPAAQPGQSPQRTPLRPVPSSTTVRKTERPSSPPSANPADTRQKMPTAPTEATTTR